MSRRVYITVRNKRAWQEPIEPAEAEYQQTIGAKGCYTRGYLPHYDKPGTIQMTWKGYTALASNKILGRSGAFWQSEFWDRYIRNENHFNKALHYIEWNPVKSGLVKSSEEWSHTSANPKWQWSSPNRYGS